MVLRGADSQPLGCVQNAHLRVTNINIRGAKFTFMHLNDHLPPLCRYILLGRTRGATVKYPKAPLPGSLAALNVKRAAKAAAAEAAAAGAPSGSAQVEEEEEQEGGAAAGAGAPAGAPSSVKEEEEEGEEED